jgi:uncharacterized protein with NRDE domain
MCLILFAWNAHPKYKLVLAANRDEFFARPTQRAGFWKENKDILAGKDLKAGGTWMGVNRWGSFSAVTNFRQAPFRNNYPKSRGELPIAYLSKQSDPSTFIEKLAAKAGDYAPFNLLTGNSDTLRYYSNQTNEITKIVDGVHGLSNHLLNTPWPKVAKGKSALENWLQDKNPNPMDLFGILEDKSEASENDLPNTGVEKDWEKKLSAMFIESPEYGTRSSTLLLMDTKGEISFFEKGYQSTAQANIRIFSFKQFA